MLYDGFNVTPEEILKNDTSVSDNKRLLRTDSIDSNRIVFLLKSSGDFTQISLQIYSNLRVQRY